MISHRLGYQNQAVLGFCSLWSLHNKIGSVQEHTSEMTSKREFSDYNQYNCNQLQLQSFFHHALSRLVLVKLYIKVLPYANEKQFFVMRDFVSSTQKDFFIIISARWLFFVILFQQDEGLGNFGQSNPILNVIWIGLDN